MGTVAYPIGKVVGLLLDRHSSSKSGTARLRATVGGSVAESLVAFRGVDAWRIESESHVRLSTGSRVHEGRPGQPNTVTALRPSHPPLTIAALFPLRASVWGRASDDFSMQEANVGKSGVEVRLASNDGCARTGRLEIDANTGVIKKMLLDDMAVEVLEVVFQPVDGRFFDPATLQARMLS